MEVDKKKGKRSKRSPGSEDEKLAKRLEREGVEVEMQEQRPRRKATEGVSYVQQKPVTTTRRMVTAKRAPKIKQFLETAPAEYNLPYLKRVQLPAEYYRPRSEKVRTSSSSLSKKSSKSSNASYERTQQPLEGKFITKLEKLNLGEYEDITDIPQFKNFPKLKELPKLKRDDDLLTNYKNLENLLKEDIIKPVKKIYAQEDLIEKLHNTISPNLQQWLNTLKHNGITKTELANLSNIVDDMSDQVLDLMDRYNAIKPAFEELFKMEEDRIKELLSRQDKRRIKRTGKIGESDIGDYMASYYIKRAEDMLTRQEEFDEYKEEIIKTLDEYNGIVSGAVELMEHATEFVEKYKQAIEEYEASKKKKKGNLDDLISMFGKL